MTDIGVTVDAARELGEQNRYWRYLGYDECNYTYMPEGVELLDKFGALADAPYYVRTHFLFCNGSLNGTQKFGSTNIYHEDRDGNPVYWFDGLDRIVDAIVRSGNKPFVELGFMPMDLVDRRYVLPCNGGGLDWYRTGGWTCPPKSYEAWHAFIAAVAEHLKERYGERELATWYFELWNEPDIFYWSGSAAEYCKLYDYTEDALHGVLPDVHLAGPACTSIGEDNGSHRLMQMFLEHCREGANWCTGGVGARLDFITFHSKGGGFGYEMDADKAVPCVESMVEQVTRAMELISAEGFADREIVISEADPDGWAAGGLGDNINMRFRNTEYYASFVALAYKRIEDIARKYGTRINPLAWAFMFPGEDCFAGTRTFSTRGIDKAILNLWRMYAKLGSRRLECQVEGGIEAAPAPEAPEPRHYDGSASPAVLDAFATIGEADGDNRAPRKPIRVMVIRHADDIDRTGDQAVALTVTGLGEATRAIVRHWRVDADHSNAHAEWLRQGSPVYPDGETLAAIKEREGLEQGEPEREVAVEGGALRLDWMMPTHAVSLVEIEALD